MQPIQLTDAPIIAIPAIDSGIPVFRFSSTNGAYFGEWAIRTCEALCYSGKGLCIDVGSNVSLTSDDLYEAISCIPSDFYMAHCANKN